MKSWRTAFVDTNHVRISDRLKHRRIRSQNLRTTKGASPKYSSGQISTSDLHTTPPLPNHNLIQRSSWEPPHLLTLHTIAAIAARCSSAIDPMPVYFCNHHPKAWPNCDHHLSHQILACKPSPSLAETVLSIRRYAQRLQFAQLVVPI